VKRFILRMVRCAVEQHVYVVETFLLKKFYKLCVCAGLDGVMQRIRSHKKKLCSELVQQAVRNKFCS
jgi:hypothetical protein